MYTINYRVGEFDNIEIQINNYPMMRRIIGLLEKDGLPKPTVITHEKSMCSTLRMDKIENQCECFGKEHNRVDGCIHCEKYYRCRYEACADVFYSRPTIAQIMKQKG